MILASRGSTGTCGSRNKQIRSLTQHNLKRSLFFYISKRCGKMMLFCSTILDSATRGEQSAYFRCGIVNFVQVRSWDCHDPSMYWVLVTKTPEMERSRVTFVKERVFKTSICSASNGMRASSGGSERTMSDFAFQACQYKTRPDLKERLQFPYKSPRRCGPGR